MSHLRRARLGTRRPSDHERARRLAAEDLHEPLGAEQSTWLEAHLAGCPACVAVAAEYAAQRDALRALPKAEPPRDLWTRTSAALDREQARKASGRRFGLAFERRLMPAGALAGALVVAVVVTTSIFSTGIGLLGEVPPPASGAPSIVLPSVAALPTPVTVAAGDVAWLAPQDDGTYALNIAPVDRVCPPQAQADCAPIDGSGRSVVLLSAAPRAVVKSPTASEVVVVDAATKTSGGTIYVVPLAAAPASTPPGQSPTPIPLATEEPTAEPFESASVEPTPTASSGPSEGSPSPTPSEAPPSASPPPGESPSPSASPTASPSPGGVVAIASDVIVVGETAAYSPDGAWFAFTARPADGSTGPDIYVWHVGDPAAHAVTTDHASEFSAWDDSFVVGSRAVPLSASPEPSLSAQMPGSPEGFAPTSPEPLPSPAAPTVAPELSPTPIPGTDASAGPSSSDGAFPPASPSPELATPISFLLDPTTGRSVDLTAGAWRPVPDPTGRYVVYWQGTLQRDPASGTWLPAGGSLMIAPWTWLSAGVPTSPDTGQVVFPDASPVPSGPTDGSPTGPETTAEPPDGFATPTPSGPEQTETPSAPPTEPAPLGSPGASASPMPVGPLTAPTPLLPPDATGQEPILSDWDIRWDATGSHLGVWIADALDPQLGRLSLLAVDPTTGQVAQGADVPVDQPALPGFSIGADRLAWATPAGQDGMGSQLKVFAWTATATGNADGQPAMGPDQVIVVR